MVTATAREENCEFFVTLGPVNRTVVGILTQLANLYASLIGFHPCRLKDQLLHNGPTSMQNLLLLQLQ